MKNIFLGMMWLGAASSATALAAGSDELWEVSSKMEMAGMPFAMPGQTSKVCIQKGHEKDPNNAVPKEKNSDCVMSDVKTSAKKSTWKMKCEGKEPMTGTGEMTYGDGTSSGKMKMHSKDGDMTMAYEGKRIGSCDYATEGPQATGQAMIKKMEGDQAKALAKNCKEAMDDNSYGQFLKPDCSWAKDAAGKKICAQASCTDFKPQMCDRLSKRLGNTDEYKAIAGNKDARKLTKECGLPFEKATREFCRKQLDSKNYEDLAQYCEKEARPLFDKHCAGRGYTAAMDSGYGPICRRFGKWKGHDDKNADESEGAASDKKTDSDTDSPVNKLLDGAKGLKGLFKF
ncbi:MAG: DUF3617 family protein [Gallionella sp.]